MIRSLKAYPAYKDSGVPWLGKVPAHWDVRRLKYVLRERDTRSLDGAEQLLRVSQYTGVTQRKRADGGDEPDTRAESLVGYKRVEPNELVVNIMLAWNGSMGVSPFSGIASPAYCVYRFVASAQPWYFHHLLRSPAYKARIKAVSTGVVESRLRLYTDDLYRLEAFRPPLSEQASIIRFLGHADRRIWRYIRAKQKLIKLLNEQKQAIIHRAITRGLDPNVRLKPSGVEWLGDVPDHWEVKPLKSVAFVQSGLTLGKHYSSSRVVEYPYLRVANVQAGHLNLNTVKRISVPDADAPRCTLRTGDVLMTEGGDPDKLGRGCVWESQVVPCLHQNHIFAVRPTPARLRPYFLSALLAAPYAKVYFLRRAKQTTNLASTNKTTIGQFPVLLPSVEEQASLLGVLEAQTADVNRAITGAQREIDLIREYRTRLIADVVTGKLDVRAAAAQLPDEPEEPEVVAETEALDEKHELEETELDIGAVEP
jgi:type I restriction enzyme S subunit